MDRRSLLIGLFVGIGVIVGPWVGYTAVDQWAGIDPPDVTSERINDTHAAVAWHTSAPTTGVVQILTSDKCGKNSAEVFKSFPITSKGHDHIAVVPVYAIPQTDSVDLKWYSVRLKVEDGRDSVWKEIHRETVSGACS